MKFDAETVRALLDTRIAELDKIIEYCESKIGDEEYAKKNYLDNGELECDIENCKERLGELYFIKETLFGEEDEW